MADVASVLVATPALPTATVGLGAGLTLRTLPACTSVRLQLARRFVPDAAAIRLRGIALPTASARVQTGDPTVLWLAPDGWLAMSESVDAIRLCDELRAACGSRVAAAVDVSDSLVRFELSGASAWQLLARGCSVDFSPDRFASGQAIRTRLAQLAVIVHAPSAATLHIVVDRGPARWLRDWLVDAATGVNRRE